MGDLHEYLYPSCTDNGLWFVCSQYQRWRRCGVFTARRTGGFLVLSTLAQSDWMNDWLRGCVPFSHDKLHLRRLQSGKQPAKELTIFFYLQNTYKRNKLVGLWRNVLLALHVDKISAALNLTCNPNDGSVTQWTERKGRVLCCITVPTVVFH